MRIGIHTGEPQVTDEGYVGIDVHMAARIAACAHGGQIVLSRRSKELVDGTWVLKDLGEHRLKDLAGPVRLYQLGAGDFPVLRSLSPSNLPVPVSSFVGRRRELRDAARTLAGARLLTLTGPGGVGKTRFAIALARGALDRYPDGVWWVPLAALRDPRLVMRAIARTVGASGDLVEHAAGRRMLIVLDNFEQVIPAATDLCEVLLACPQLTMLVTSRELLRLDGEVEYALAPLDDGDGTALFAERARATSTDAIVELCRRLEGLPLAIELAAARASLLEPEQILERLGSRLDAFRAGRGADPRHATLRATLDWSHGLMNATEQAAFARFSVFAGGATIDAVEAVAEADTDIVQSLLDKSLLRRSGRRLWMLETVREYAAERLRDLPDAFDVAGRHARFYLEVARSTNLNDAAAGEAQHALAVAEQANFRTALDWSLTRGEIELGLRLATALENFWVASDLAEASRWFDRLLERAAGVAATVRAAALLSYGSVAAQSGDDLLAERMFLRSLEEYRQLGDADGIGAALVRVAHSAWYRGDIETALELAREGLERCLQVRNERHLAQAIGLMGDLEFEQGAHDVGLDLLDQSARTAAECGFRWWQARMLLRMARRAHQIGRDDDARRWVCASLRVAREIGDRRRIVQLLDLLSSIAAKAGDWTAAGWLRGAVEAESARSPLAAWTMAKLSVDRHVEFEQAREAGRMLAIERAADEVLESWDTAAEPSP